MSDNNEVLRSFATDCADKQYLSPVGLYKGTISPDFSSRPIDVKDEQVFFKALHYIRYRLQKALNIGDQLSVTKWENLYISLRNKIVISYLPLIHDCIRRSSIRVDDYDEMFSLGSEALISAAEAFDPWKGFKFSTYACRSIFYRFSAASKKIHHSVVDVHDIDIPADEADDNEQLYIERITNAINKANLTDREKDILSLRFSNPKKTLGDISKKYGISKERVRQIQVNAINKLRDYLEKDPILK